MSGVPLSTAHNTRQATVRFDRPTQILERNKKKTVFYAPAGWLGCADSDYVSKGKRSPAFRYAIVSAGKGAVVEKD